MKCNDKRASTTSNAKAMIKAAKKRGYVTHDEIIKVLPEEEFTSEQIEEVLAQLSEVGVNVIESEDTPDDDDDGEKPKEAAEEGKAVAAKGSTAVRNW